MLIANPHYPQFSTALHLEELTLMLAREILEQQKTASSNLGNDQLIIIDINETKETAKVSVTDIMATLDNGALKIKTYFGGYDFTPGVGAYPFNQTNLVDAFVAVAFYHQFKELNQSINPAFLQCVDFSIQAITDINSAMQLSIDITITELPIVIINTDTTTSKAKPYLL